MITVTSSAGDVGDDASGEAAAASAPREPTPLRRTDLLLDTPAAVLVARARAGDEDAFAVLVRTHQDRAYRVALRMTGRPQDAEDVVQDAFLQAWTALPRFRQDAQFGTWLTRIVLNRCADLRRAQRPTEELPEEVAATAPGPEVEVVSRDRAAAAAAAVLQLPFDQRAALVLHTIGGYSYAEVGRILGVAEGTARVRVHRSRKALSAGLREWR